MALAHAYTVQQVTLMNGRIAPCEREYLLSPSIDGHVEAARVLAPEVAQADDDTHQRVAVVVDRV